MKSLKSMITNYHKYVTNLSLDVTYLPIEDASTLSLPSLKEDEVFGRPSDEH
jgi:hypothetical protein